MMKKLWMIISIACFLIVPVLAYAELDELLQDIFGNNARGVVSLDELSVAQMEMTPDSPRDGQPVAFSAIIANGSRREVKLLLAVLDRDRVVTQLNDAYLRPGNNQIYFPETNIEFSRGEQRCFTIQTNIDQRWVSITMPTAFCPENSRRGRAVDLSIEGLRMSPDPASPGQEISFAVRLRNDGRNIRGNIRIQDSDQVVVQTGAVSIPRGVTNFNLPGSQYTFQRMGTCFTVSVDVDRTPYPVDASEEYCVKPTAWTLKSRKIDHRENSDSRRKN